MRTNTNTRRLTLNAIFLAMGLVLHQITPPIFTIKPDTTLIMLFTLMVINRDSYKTCLVAGIVAGIFAGMTSAFPGGQIPNVIDKFLTTNIIFLVDGNRNFCKWYNILNCSSNNSRTSRKLHNVIYVSSSSSSSYKLSSWSINLQNSKYYCSKSSIKRLIDLK